MIFTKQVQLTSYECHVLINLLRQYIALQPISTDSENVQLGFQIEQNEIERNLLQKLLGKKTEPSRCADVAQSPLESAQVRPAKGDYHV